MGVWLLKSKLALLTSCFAVAYVLFFNAEVRNFFNRLPVFSKSITLVLSLLAIICAFTVSLPIFSRHTERATTDLSFFQIPYCKTNPALEHKLSTSVTTRATHVVQTFSSINILFGSGQHGHYEWRVGEDLNYANRANYKNPSVLSSENFFVETLAMHGLFITALIFLIPLFTISQIT